MLNETEDLKSRATTPEFIRMRQRLRQLMLQAHADGRFGDALTEAIASLELSQAYYASKIGQPLVGDMVRNSKCGNDNCTSTGFRVSDNLPCLRVEWTTKGRNEVS